MMEKSFEVWVETENSAGFCPLMDSYYDVAQEFQSGNIQSQLKALRSVMERTWRASKDETAF